MAKIKAYAKINLTLDVLGKMEDGYHQVEMVMQQINLYDELIISKKNGAGILIECDDPQIPLGEENLIYKAIARLFERAGWKIDQGVKVQLEKNIPPAAGLAGGSSDAAAAMLGVNELFELGFTQEQLMEIATPLGADIPFCILGGTAFAEGKGDVLTPVKSNLRIPLLLVKPPFGVSTAEVYKGLDLSLIKERPDNKGAMEALTNGEMEGLIESTGNVLERVTAEMHREIGQIKAEMMALGARKAVMSGSGPSVFAILPQDFSIGKRMNNYFVEKGYFTCLTTTI